MCRQANCAFRKKDGYCLVHKAACTVLNPSAHCRDGVAKLPAAASASQRRYMGKLKLGVDKSGTVGSCLHPGRRREFGNQVFKACKRKTRFPTHERARSMAVAIGRRDKVVLAVYECPFCHGYHLTRQLRSALRWNGNPNFELTA